MASRLARVQITTSSPGLPSSTETPFCSPRLPSERIRRGIESLRRRDAVGARSLERWYRRLIDEHHDRIFPIDLEVAKEWGQLGVPNPIPVLDRLLAATAKVYGLTLATRNNKDLIHTGVALVNPFLADRLWVNP